MNPHTGHLISFADESEMVRAMKQEYARIPLELEKEAAAALNGKPEAHVNLHARGPLQDWAKKKRKEKIAAQSRRANRG